MKVAAFSSAEFNAMTDSQIDELIHGIHQLEASKRRWKKLLLGASIVLGFLVVTQTITTAMLARQAEEVERQAREAAEQLMAERDRVLMLEREAAEQRRQIEEEINRASARLEEVLSRSLLRPLGSGPGLPEMEFNIPPEFADKPPKNDPTKK
jgi:E3 ubiquitin-protein ligase DOA10